MTNEALLDRIESTMHHGEPKEAAAVLAAALRGLAERGREIRDAIGELEGLEGLAQWQLDEALAQLDDLALDA